MILVTALLELNVVIPNEFYNGFQGHSAKPLSRIVLCAVQSFNPEFQITTFIMLKSLCLWPSGF